MRLLPFTLLITGLISINVQSQNPDFEWAVSSDGAIGYSIITDDNGDVYTTGVFTGTVDFDPGTGTNNLTAVGNKDVFIQKLDPNGSLIWAVSFGGSDQDQGTQITIDPSGNVIATGNFRGMVDFDPGTGTHHLTSNGSTDIYILKLDVNGNFIWAQSIGASSFDSGICSTTDDSGNIFTTGNYRGTVDFDPSTGTSNLTAVGIGDIFILKLESNGNFVWVKSMGGPTQDYGYSIELDQDGNIYTTGAFSGTADFDPGTGVSNFTSNGVFDVFVNKLDINGDLVWNKSFGGSDFDDAYDISIDSTNNVLITGYFQNVVDFDPSTVGTTNLTSSGGKDQFIQKLDSDGNFLWATSTGGTSDDLGRGIAVDKSGNVYTTGAYQGTVDFNPSTAVFNLTSSSSNDEIFIQKLDPNGNFLWAKSMGGTNNDQGASITIDNSGSIYSNGFFAGTADFDPGTPTFNLTATSNEAQYVQKLGSCTPNSSVDTQLSCGPFTWIDGNTYTVDNNTATYTLTNMGGCDSTVTLNLTVNPPVNATITETDPTITANQSGATYQWLDCDNNYSPIPGATSQSFTASANGSYAVEVTMNGCSATSSCVTIEQVVDIDDYNLSNEFLVFPNPTNNIITIQQMESKPINLAIFNHFGQLVYSETNIWNKNHQIQLSEYTPGVYQIQISSESNQQVFKIIKL